MNTTDVQGPLRGCVGNEYLLCVLQYLLLNPVLGFTSTSCLDTSWTAAARARSTLSYISGHYHTPWVHTTSCDLVHPLAAGIRDTLR